MQRTRDVPTNGARAQKPKILTRAIVARMLSCSIAMVRWFEDHDRLHPIIDSHKVRRFDRDEVEALCRERRRTSSQTSFGALAAEVFRLFAEGRSLPEVVIETRQEPDVIRTLWQEYKRPLDAPPVMATASLEDLSDYEKRARVLDDQIEARRQRLRGK
jgi:hypothetical protein